MLRQEEGAVTVAEEAEAVRQCPVIDTMPVVPDEGCDEKEERAVRLVEVRHHPTDDPIGIAWCDDDARGEDERLLAMSL